MKLRDRTVWLIGASSGIGEALVPRLVASGAQLAISSRTVASLEAAAGKWGTPEAPVLVKPLDVTRKEDLPRVAAELRAEWGSIDVMVYNAGAWTPTDVAAFDVDAFERQVAVNYVGLVRAIGAVLPEMLTVKGAEIVGVASVSAYGGLPRAEAYGSSKAAVNYLLQSLRIDLRKRGIGVTTVNPGFVRTPLTDRNDFPMPFMVSAEEAAERIVKGLLQGKKEIHFPIRLSVPLKLVTALPRPVYEWLVCRAMKR